MLPCQAEGTQIFPGSTNNLGGQLFASSVGETKPLNISPKENVMCLQMRKPMIIFKE